MMRNYRKLCGLLLCIVHSALCIAEKESIMKQRIITSIIGLAIVIPFFIFMHSAAFPVFVAIVSVLAVYEVIKATGGKNNLLLAISCLTAAAIPFFFHFNIEIPFMPAAILYTLAYFIIMVPMHKKTTFNDVITALFAALAIPCSLSVLIELRDIYIDYAGFTKSSGVFLIIFGLFCSWMTDIFAYFSGRFLGKHKLCPEISPKKTVEGAIGGVIGAVIFNLILFFIFDKFFFTTHTIQWWQIIIISIVLSVVSMFGDLSASIIKRNHGIKDFGKILPGHGGIMDRFDSCLFVLPALYVSVYILTRLI